MVRRGTASVVTRHSIFPHFRQNRWDRTYNSPCSIIPQLTTPIGKAVKLFTVVVPRSSPYKCGLVTGSGNTLIVTVFLTSGYFIVSINRCPIPLAGHECLSVMFDIMGVSLDIIHRAAFPLLSEVLLTPVFDGCTYAPPSEEDPKK